GVPKDEGQHVQSVYKPAKYYGGPGLFAFSNDARLDEHSELINYKNKDQLYEEWGRYWDKSKPVLIEKSPPNLIRTRFLQELFPKAYFITIIRHPIAVSYATKKWSKTSMDRLIKHWICAHTIYLEDRSNLSNEIFFSYEHMIHSPENVIRSIEKFIDIKIP